MAGEPIMVLVLHGNLEIDAHVYSGTGNLIWLEHFILERPQYEIIFKKRGPFTRAHHALSYHLIEFAWVVLLQAESAAFGVSERADPDK